MSVPTMRTPRSPFSRSARRSAAVPGAPAAVTRTVMSRIDAAMLLKAAACDADRVDAVVNQLEDCVGIELEPERGGECHASGSLAFSAAVRRGDSAGEQESDPVPSGDLA